MDIRVSADLVAGSRYGSLSAAWFWRTNNLDKILAETADEAKACELVTHRINGGRIGFAERRDWTQQAMLALK